MRKGTRFQSRSHAPQPGSAFGSSDAEACVGLPQAYPPTALRVAFRTAEELYQKRCELFDGTPEGTRKERPQQSVAIHSPVKFRRQLAATRSAANLFEQPHVTSSCQAPEWFRVPAPAAP